MKPRAPHTVQEGPHTPHNWQELIGMMNAAEGEGRLSQPKSIPSGTWTPQNIDRVFLDSDKNGQVAIVTTGKGTAICAMWVGEDKQLNMVRKGAEGAGAFQADDQGVSKGIIGRLDGDDESISGQHFHYRYENSEAKGAKMGGAASRISTINFADAESTNGTAVRILTLTQ